MAAGRARSAVIEAMRPVRDGLLQSMDRKLRRQRSIQSPSHNLPGKAIQNHCQIDKLLLHTNERDVREPALIYTAELHPARQVQVDLQFMIGVGGTDETRAPQGQKIVQTHQSHHAFVIHPKATVMQFCREASVPVTQPVLDRNCLNG